MTVPREDGQDHLHIVRTVADACCARNDIRRGTRVDNTLIILLPIVSGLFLIIMWLDFIPDSADFLM